MKVVYSPEHIHHDIPEATWVGVLIPTDELPARVDVILEQLGDHELTEAVEHDDTVLDRVHDPAMTRYMAEAYRDWKAAGYLDDPGQPYVTAYAFPHSKLMGSGPVRIPASPAARAGTWATDTMTPIGEGTFRAARAAVDVAETAADLMIGGEQLAYAATRPPGHHAGRAFFGGSCYLNNAAVAVERLTLNGFTRVAVVDIDAHHGNGTQEIFYERGDVFYGSVHIDPGAGWYPHFVGFADEKGDGDGLGANLNVPLPPGTGDDGWLRGLDRVLEGVERFGADVIVASLGVDAGATDENSPLEVTEDGFRAAGRLIGARSLPVLAIQEGGYDLQTLGALVAACLGGLDVSPVERQQSGGVPEGGGGAAR